MTDKPHVRGVPAVAPSVESAPPDAVEAIYTSVKERDGIVKAGTNNGTYVADAGESRLRTVVLLIDADLKMGDDSFLVAFVAAVQRGIQAVGACCVVERTRGPRDRLDLGDGALTIGPGGRDLVAAHRHDAPPLVGLLLDPEQQPGRRASVFVLADRDAGLDAGRILRSRACFDILFLGRRDISACRERLAGVEQAAVEGGATALFMHCDLSHAAGLRLGAEIALDTSGRKLGVVATNDSLALGFRAALRDRPDAASHNVHIVSFDGLPIVSDPALDITSLPVPIDEIALDAVAELQRLNRSPASTGRVVRYTLR